MVFILVLETFVLHYTGQGVLLSGLFQTSQPFSNRGFHLGQTGGRLLGFCLAVQHEKDLLPEAVLLIFT